MADDSERLKAKYENKGFSYLSWKCSLDMEGCEDLHITAKFLGKQPVTKEDIFGLLDPLDIPLDVDVDEVDWVAEEWDTKNDGKTKVLRLNRYPASMVDLHEALAPLRDDDYPEYKPHITVPDAVWALVKGDDMSPEYVGPTQLGLKIGPLVLSNQGEKSEL